MTHDPILSSIAMWVPFAVALLGQALAAVDGLGSVTDEVLRPGLSIEGVVDDESPVVETAVLVERYAAPVVGCAYRIEVEQAGTYHVDLRSHVFDAYLVLRDGEGRVLAEDDDGLLGTHARVVLELLPGQDVIAQAGALHGKRGAFVVSLVRGPPPRLDAAQLAEAEIEDKLQRVAALEKTLGKDSTALATALNDAAQRLYDRGDDARARPLFERSLEIFEAEFGPEHPYTATMLNNLAFLMRRQGELEDALRLQERVLSIRESALGAVHPDTAHSLDSVAVLLSDLARFDEARDLHERALRIRETVLGKDHPLTSTSLNNLALVFLALGDPESARPLVERAIAIREAALGPDHLHTALALNSLSSVLNALGDLSGSHVQLKRALDIYEARLGPDHPQTARCASNLGYRLIEVGEFASAQSQFEDALRCLEAALGPEHRDVIPVVNGLALAIERSGDFARAQELYERAVTMNQAAFGPEHPQTAISFNNLASVLETRGDPDAARRAFTLALEIYERVYGSEHPEVATTLGNLASLLRRRGDYAGSRELFERALAISEAVLVDGHPDTMLVRSNLAVLLLEQGDLESARLHFERVHRSMESSRSADHPTSLRALNNLAVAIREKGDVEDARELLEQVLLLNDSAGRQEHGDAAIYLNNLASIANAEKDYKEARRLLDRALAIREATVGADHPKTASVLHNSGMTLMALGDSEGAARLFERALQIQEAALGAMHPDTIGTLNRLAQVRLQSGRGDLAAEALDAAEAGERSHLSHLLARFSESESLQYLRGLFWQLELRLSGATRSDGESYQSVLHWKGQALRAARWRRERLTSSADRAKVGRLAVIAGQLSRFANSPMSMDEWNSNALGALVEERQRLERELMAGVESDERSRPTWSHITRALPEDAALVDFLIHREYRASDTDGGEQTYRWSEPLLSAWITRKEQARPQHVDLGPVAKIDEALQQRGGTLTAPRGGSLSGSSSGSTLRSLLWDPIERLLEGVSTVFVSPDGLVATVPFEVLRGQDDRFLVEDRGFVYLTDPTMLITLATRDREARNSGALLTVGGVDYETADELPARHQGTQEASDAPVSRGVPIRSGGSTHDWVSLPATHGEVDVVVKTHRHSLERGERTVLTGSAATEEAFKGAADDASFIHLATHGYFHQMGLASLQAPTTDPEREARSLSPGLRWEAQRLEGRHPGLLSGLVFAGVNSGLPRGRDDGFLTAEEVCWLDLSTCELVVLSACETGLGRTEAGEGLLGLRRAFLVAGATTVISSLWSVDDTGTAELMGRFYHHLWEGDLGRHAALRQAQLDMILADREAGRGARPEAWGAFVIDGDWR